MDLIDSTQEFLLNYPQQISLWKGDFGSHTMKTVDEIFAELASLKWIKHIPYNCAEVMVWREDPSHVFLNRLVTVTFIDLTNCDEDDFESEPEPSITVINVIDLTK